jgi:DNA-binding transcriptional LysR family regulator
MRGAEFAQLSAFAAIAEHGSFVRAAAALGVSTSTLSQTMRALEERLGVRLLNRTTRSVAPTEAGDRLLARIRPALAELGSAVEAVNAFRDRPAGTLRLNVASLAGRMVIAPIVARFLAAYPAIALDLTVDDGMIDIVGGRFDAGIRAGRWIERDMIAVRISAESRLLAVASPDYLARHPSPAVPQDLQHHNCIRFRGAGAVFRWEFEKGGERTEVSVEGSLITTDIDLMLRAGLDGVGICYMLEGYVAPHLTEGRLVRLLDDWAPRYAGYHVFYPSRRQMPAPLKVFIDFLRDAAPLD